ncbi:lipoyl synthase [Geothrix rubra]|uniref:Lipoyl synthase n=1 Tax=Geothrix rubra TaxID=2927977 RepID=A0ABQ5Q6N1_9BACT|nr:lipoyl synthase [Geothrix rubra]GLH70071.1 lipoyl synthase [Geothrix rubra]
MARPPVLPGPRPDWLKIRVPAPEVVAEVESLIREQRLVTVCEEARCPNLHECWGVHRTATFMLMGEICTRHCGFCNVGKGRPGDLDPGEPQRVAEAVARLGLRFAVVTSVNRDDLPDGGAAHFAATIRWIRALSPACGVEVLVPDFRGNEAALRTVLEAQPEVLNHNVETVPHLYRRVRPDADYRQSLDVLRRAADWRDTHAPAMRVKSGIMVGLGETPEQVLELMADWRRSRVDIATLGQYLPPSELHLPLHRFVEPAEFEMYRAKGLEMGFQRVESAPLVRSSYHARESYGG